MRDHRPPSWAAPIARQGLAGRDEGFPADSQATAKETDPLPALLSTAEIAEQFGRSPRTMRRWIRCGYLVPVRVGGAVFFRVEDLRQLIVERLIASISKPNATPRRVPGERIRMEDNTM